ncbi:MAG: hypothetical protein ACIAQU_05970 [Phycisphaerales bacterium JB064]
MTDTNPPPQASTATESPLSPAFLWRKLVESWKHNPWPTIVMLITIGGAVVAAVSSLGSWLAPSVVIIGLLLIIAGMTYLTVSAIRVRRLVVLGPGDALAQALLLREMYAAMCVAIAIIITMPSSWSVSGLHVAEAIVAHDKHRLNAYLRREEPDDRTNEQKLAESMETLARNEDTIDRARGVGVAQYAIRYGVAVWALLLALVHHGFVMVCVLVWLSRLSEAQSDGLQAASESQDKA